MSHRPNCDCGIAGRDPECPDDEPIALNVGGAMKLMDERDALRAALERLREFSQERIGWYKGVGGRLTDHGAGAYSEAMRFDDAISAASKAQLNRPSSMSGPKAVDDLLTDLLDYFEPKIDADIDGTGKAMSNAEMKLYQRIKELRK